MNEELSIFAHNLRVAIAATGQSVNALAKSADVSPSALAAYRDGERQPQLLAGARVAATVGVPLVKLLLDWTLSPEVWAELDELLDERAESVARDMNFKWFVYGDAVVPMGESWVCAGCACRRIGGATLADLSRFDDASWTMTLITRPQEEK